MAALLTNAGGNLTTTEVIDWRENQVWDVAIGNVPTKTTGQKLDDGHAVINPKTIVIKVRLTSAQKTTLQAIIDANVTATLTSPDSVWVYTVWIETRAPKYKHAHDGATDKSWETTIAMKVLSGGKA